MNQINDKIVNTATVYAWWGKKRNWDVSGAYGVIVF